MRQHTSKKLMGLLLAFASYTPMSFSYAKDNAHFWKVAQFHGESTTGRWDKDQLYDACDWLTKLDVSYDFCSAKKSFNNHGSKVPLLSVFGDQNMLYLFTNVVKLPSEVQYAEFLGNLVNSSMTNGTFGLLEFKGKFEMNEVNIDWKQNLAFGLFFRVNLPIRDISIKHVTYEDESPLTGMFSQANPDWIRLLNNLNVILNNHGYHDYNAKFSKTDVGDLTLSVGWQHVDMDSFDFLKWLRAEFEVGALFPTGAKADPNYVFSIPTGYNGHYGITISGCLDFGITNWLTWGVRGGAIFFFDRSLSTRLKTFSLQNGFIKLAKGNAKEEHGTVWHLGTDLKLDHVFAGFSFLFGYSYNRGEKNHLRPRNSCTETFDADVIDSDATLRSWQQHVLHFLWDYDFSVHMPCSKYAPRLNLFYNLPVDGKNIFDTGMIGGGAGVDIRWDF